MLLAGILCLSWPAVRVPHRRDCFCSSFYASGLAEMISTRALEIVG